jgi:glutamate racemase
MGPGVTLVDSALETAKALQVLLQAKGLLREVSKPGNHLFFTTDDPMKFDRHAALFLGKEQSHARLTDLGLE